jgi:transcriptional regulator with XRE-family HTH domain
MKTASEQAPAAGESLELGADENRFRARRLKLGFSQHEVARRAGLWQARVSTIERNLAAPFPDERARLAAVLELQEEELFPVVPGCPPSRRERLEGDALRELEARAVEMYLADEGSSYESVGTALGKSGRQVGRYLRDAGVARSQGARPKYDDPGERICAHEDCDKPFRPTRTQAAAGWGKFCSLEHYWTSSHFRAMSSERLTALHADPIRNAKWGYKRHGTTHGYGRAASAIAATRGNRPGPKSKAEKLRSQIVAAWKEGVSQPRIARRFEVSRGAVQRQLDKARALGEI